MNKHQQPNTPCTQPTHNRPHPQPLSKGRGEWYALLHPCGDTHACLLIVYYLLVNRLLFTYLYFTLYLFVFYPFLVILHPLMVHCAIV